MSKSTSPRAGRSPRQPARRKLCRAALWLAWSMGTLRLGASATAPAPREHEIKAAFLYNFTRFIDWPADAFEQVDSAFVIAVLGDTPLTGEVERTVRERKIAGRAIEVRGVRSAPDAAAAQLVFVAADDAMLRELLLRTAGRPVVVVGESERFLRQGGTIAFLMGADDKVRFALNMSAAERARVRVSAQLQKLAKSILRDP